ncbi:hypothetical protein HJFPF1_07510 [Paramyrothecium foliicola]|nr:hypothetical protein HJFPF1_07510 [Paramyrothecium foliicola]
MARRNLSVRAHPSQKETPATPSAQQDDALPQRIYSRGLGIIVRTPGTEAHFSTKKVFYTIVLACVLIPGDGAPQHEAAVVVEDKIIVWVGKQSEVPSKYTEKPHKTHSVPYLMPGLWDCHCHFEGTNGIDAADAGGIDSEHPATYGARLAKQCWEALQRGYTSLRDVAGYGCEIASAIEDGTIVGPNIYSSGACLSQLAGHGDTFQRSAGDVLLNYGVHPQPGHYASKTTCIVDGVDECRRGVRLQIRRGAKCIKILASGGVLSRDDDPLLAQFSPEELKVIVEEATRMNRAVAAHVHGKPGILAAVNAGVTSVEHVTFADQECIDLIKAKGTIYVATRTIVDLLVKSGGKDLPSKVWEKVQLVNTRHVEAYKHAIEAGVTIALGTDTPPGFNMALELEYAVQAGLSNLEAIKAATANGPLTVKGQAPRTGQIKEGYEADLIGILDDPVADVKILQDKQNIGWVWKGGKLFKGPGVGPWGE